MKVTTTSEQPQMRSAKTPYTSATIRVSNGRSSAEQEVRNQELAFLSLLVQALNPRISIKRVNDALRTVINPEAGLDFEGGRDAQG